MLSIKTILTTSLNREFVETLRTGNGDFDNGYSTFIDDSVVHTLKPSFI